MSDCVSSKFVSVFNLFCWIATILLSTYWIYVFLADEDLVKVEYKKYFTEKKDVFPELSFCLKDAISEEKLSKISSHFSVSAYLEFLKGSYFNPSMLNIKHESIIKNMSDYIEEDGVLLRNGSFLTIHSAYEDNLQLNEIFLKNVKKRVYPSYSSFFWYNSFYNCYSFRIPDDINIKSYWYRVRNTIFSNGVRSNSFGLITFLHYPNQLMVSAKTMKYIWPHRKSDETYLMRFDIDEVEILRRRQKRSRPCSEFWSEYDNEIKTKHSNDFGCMLPYMHLTKNVTPCNNKTQMRNIFYLRFDDYGVLPPCQTMENIHYQHSERTIDVKEETWMTKESFLLGISVAENHFKEITQTK